MLLTKIFKICYDTVRQLNKEMPWGGILRYDSKGSGCKKPERRANAKSLLGVLSMGVTQGTKIQLIADGPGEGEAVEELAALLAGDQAE